MWIRRSEYVELVKAAAIAQEFRLERRDEQRRNAIRVGQLEAEIKRLTNVIIQLKEQGYSLRPEDTDERWGRYSIADEEEKLAEQPARSRAPTPDEADVLELERELRAEVEAALDD